MFKQSSFNSYVNFLCPGTEQSEQGDLLDPLRGEEAVASGQV